MNAIGQLDAIDLQRLGVLLLAAAELSRDKYVLLRYSKKLETWRVSVRILHPGGCPCIEPPGACLGGQEHVSTSQVSPLYALDRAVQWLRAAHAQLRDHAVVTHPAGG